MRRPLCASSVHPRGGCNPFQVVFLYSILADCVDSRIVSMVCSCKRVRLYNLKNEVGFSAKETQFFYPMRWTKDLLLQQDSVKLAELHLFRTNPVPKGRSLANGNRPCYRRREIFRPPDWEKEKLACFLDQPSSFSKV